MKKAITLILCLVMLFSLVACSSGEKTTEATTEGTTVAAPATGQEKDETAAPADEQTDAEAPLSVCLIVSLLGDQAFADAAYSGLQQAEADFGDRITTKVSQCEDTALYEQQLLTACEEGYDLIICGASQWGEYMKTHCTEYPDIMFGITDTVVEGPNICSVTFAQNQGSFLAGAAAAMFTEMTEFPGNNAETIIGWVGGNEIPALKDFFLGYEAGAKYVNPDITILQSYAGSFQDPLKGKELTLAMYDQGADIVMNVASNTGNGVLEAAKESGHYAIGVDLNQDNNQPGAILTSMLKKNGNGVYYLIKNALEGTFEGNSKIYMDLNYGGVDLTDMSVFKSFCDEEQAELVDSILDYVADLKEKIISGEIIVPNYEGYGPDA